MAPVISHFGIRALPPPRPRRGSSAIVAGDAHAEVEPIPADVLPDGDGEGISDAILGRFGIVANPELIFGEYVEGVKINTGEYISTARSYARWDVRCPLANCLHKKVGEDLCRKRRNVGDAQTRRFGIAEVYAFLGLWIRRARDYLDRPSHINNSRLTGPELKAYIDEQGWAAP